MKNRGFCRIFLLLLVILSLAGCGTNNLQYTVKEISESSTVSVNQEERQTDKAAAGNDWTDRGTEQAANESQINKKLSIHFIDVGQADCALLEYDNHFMLIDAGNNADADVIVNYLENQGVGKLDYAIGTHPHEDHIGSLDTVIDTFDIGAVYMPKKAHTSKTYLYLLKTIENKGLQIQTPVPGSHFDFYGLNVQILGPVQEYDDLNNNSIVLKVTYNEISVLFTGDAEQEAETDMLEAGYHLEADVLKVGHHGSDTSSTVNFLDIVRPKVAVISVGADNSYGHPDENTLKKLMNLKATIYRTDQQGTVVVTTDGKEIEVTTEKASDQQEKAVESNTSEIQTENTEYQEIQAPQEPQKEPEQEVIVYIGNKNTHKFHDPACSFLPAEKNQVFFDNREEAVNDGYVPCKKCNP